VINGAVQFLFETLQLMNVLCLKNKELLTAAATKGPSDFSADIVKRTL
jgi:hypothetical protein